jgi:predicted NBD/HSP70 family sugar kinase
MIPNSPLWGIDLGGTKVEGVIIDPQNPSVPLQRLRRDTGVVHGYEHILSQILSVVRDLEVASGLSRPARIGIGTPGIVNPATGSLKNSNTTCLNGRPLRDDLATAWNCEVVMANDANCFALAEAICGAGRNAKVVHGLILGTGVGSGIVIQGKVLNGHHGIAGEWGHNPLCGESRLCYCGRKGCVETVIAGPSLERYYHENGGDKVRLPEIVRRAEAADSLAIQTMEVLRAKFAEAIAAVINILDPDVIVVGGGVGNVPLLYEETTRAAILRHLFNSEMTTRIIPPQLGDSAGVFGAALLTV